MRRRLPPLNALRAFEAAARLGSFTGAGRELSVAQPAITRHIANLEDWMGTPLFHRNGNAISLTAEGKTLSELTTSAFDRLELGIGDLARPGDKDREVIIGASFGITHLWVMPRISGLRSSTRAVVNFLTADDYRAFDDPGVDLSIRFGNGEFSGFQADLLFPERCYAVASPGFLAAHPEIDRANPAPALRPEWLLDHGDPYGAGWITWPRWFAQLGHPAPALPRRAAVLSYPLVLDMVQAGEGVAIGSVGLDDDLVAAGALVRLGPEVARPGYGYYLVYAPALRAKPWFEELRAHITGAP